uniref:Diphthine--ammonia ligase n=1 Tax=Tabanus bromius TaxID=304241 RepID=A0A0K8TRG8_TABBR
MRVAAMVSGGKDSCYNMMQCVAEGHEIVALANLHPKDRDELDSYMYQTVGHMGIEILAEAMGLPLYRRETKGESSQRGKHYVPTCDDEVEDLYDLLKLIKDELNIEAVAVGAILSDYQRVRVENVCSRLKLVPLAYLWRRDQTELLQEMIDCHVHAIIIKVASLGLVPDRDLGKSLREMQPHLHKMRDKYGLNVCGEGGEYETFTLDCPLFKQRIVVEDMQTVISSLDLVCPVGYINFTKLSLQPKDNIEICDNMVKKSLDYITDLHESSYSDLSDPEISEIELRNLEINSSNNDHSTCDSEDQNLASITITRSLSPVGYEREIRPIDNTPMAVVNHKGWMFISGVQAAETDVETSMHHAMGTLKTIVESHKYELCNLCYITLYIKDMLNYPLVNDIYAQILNFTNPPTRVCVECPLPDDCHVVMEAVAYKHPNEVLDVDLQRHTMHVQSISHWAPANIGPYSQATKIGDLTYISGQIALIPGSMTMIEGGIRSQCKLTLRHISRIAKAMNANGQLRDVVQGICFLTHPHYVSEARRQWETRTTNAIMDYIIVPALPRKALVEWQVWAHSHNDRFDYEETGCSIGDFTVAIRRRWNYENNCAAIVCCVSTGLATSTIQLTQSEELTANHKKLAHSLTQENFDDVLFYILRKLLKDYPPRKKSENFSDDSSNGNTPTKQGTGTILNVNNNLPAIHLKIFYQMSAIDSVNLLLDTLNSFKEKVSDVTNIAYTVLPASALYNFSTFLSIFGIRHE